MRILLLVPTQCQTAAVSTHWADRVSAGAPTALAAGAVIAVGTSHGLCLVFETHEAMRYCLGDSRSGQQLGAVSCLDLSPDSTRGGSVFELRLRRSLGRRSAAARCLFSGSRGEVVTMEPLPTAEHPTHPLQPQMIVAMATMSKVIVVSARPQLRVLFTHPLEAGPIHVPLLDWQFVVIRVGSGVNMVDPVLTFARKSTVYFYQVCCPSEQAKFVPLQWVEFPFVIQNIKWMNSRTLALVDTQEKLHLWDVRGQQQLEAVAGEKACYESCLVSGGQLMLLGTRGLHVLTLRTWLERLEAHVRAGDFAAALRLAWSLYGERSAPMMGLQGSSGRRQAIIKERMLSLVDEWLEYCLRAASPEQLLSQAVPTCVQYLLDLGER
ncbi:Vacuolar protein sorting-associated protein 8 [Amphibalanus amphitrite]|uniref:Vacuolar protein sorting-associated protein 8 n=1 Tax=Amphibalanus amphitrite TaxID=1232801 RepID=A0A6A4WFY2_AMPAM|nr:Vacuolar protein sorting-associated protein 8 [Amphibalanus amphitrite]